MNWSDMSPQERDALVAEKVMGWESVVVGTTGVAGGVEPDSNYRGHVPVPRYTTDLGCAWDVVDTADSYRVELNPYRKPPCEVWITYYPTGAYIESENRYEGEGFGVARAPTAPEAICLAALRAKGVEV